MEKKYTQHDMNVSFDRGRESERSSYQDHNLHASKETKENFQKMNDKIEKIVKDVTDIKIDFAEVKKDIGYIKKFFDQLPCKEQAKRIDDLENKNFFEKGAIAVLVFIGTILTDYVIRKFF